ncbi:MAG: hemerythrin family protein [Nitrospirota bacterium]|nr:MAG: hemerythrin family protein [Nitrospirota bacterium]
MEIEWDDSLSIGIDEIDNQHKKLVSKINELMHAMGKGPDKAREEILDTIIFLEDYMQVHFSSEEDYMINSKYPDYKEHIKEHDQFVSDIEKMKEKVISHNKPTYLGLQTEIGHMLYSWVTNHIAKLDKALGEYLIARWKNR